MAPRVFISYSSKDQAKADELCAYLTAAGITCWIAHRDIPKGESWPKHIVNAIGECQEIVLLFSANSDASPEIAREVILARGKRIIPVRIQNVVPAGELRYLLATVNWLDAFEGSFEQHLKTLVDVLESPTGSTAGLVPAPQAAVVTPEEVEAELHRIDWTLAELEHRKEPLRCGHIDDVFEPVVQFAAPLFDAHEWDACERVFLRTATGVLGVLQGASPTASLAWPHEIDLLRQSLLEFTSSLDSDPAGAQHRVERAHRLFVDFLDRVPVESALSSTRSITWGIVVTLFTISVVSLGLAYYRPHTTMTWEMRYAYTFGPDRMRCGAYLEGTRSIWLVLMLVYLFESLFPIEYSQMLLDWRLRSWKRPWVTPVRLLAIVFFACSLYTVTQHVLVNQPIQELKWASDYYDLLMSPPDPKQPHLTAADWSEVANRWQADGGVKRLLKEAAPDFDGHYATYRWYLPYCLVNYSGYAVLIIAVVLFGILTDRMRLADERDSLYQSLVDRHISDSKVDREFSRFFDVCFRHTQRYITLLVLLSGMIAYESIVTRPTLSTVGWAYELVGSTVLLSAALIWAAILVHFYESAFQRCADEKRRRRRFAADGRPSDEWEESWNTTRFLKKCFLNVRSCVALAVNLIPFIMFVTMGRH
ncbi:MAG TPA: toll/interleukin-1 receptor domain-containing protein [Planctomycetaceae bacterium]|nr:toll/interleukin-1 receptor domain-containing protein [Planctomycetaceae bacterium]